MRRRKKSDEGGFNVWRSYSDMMAGILLLFVLIMCVTLFQAQKSYDESLKEQEEKLALQEEYTQELLAQQATLEEQDEQLASQEEELAALAAQLASQQATLEEQEATLAAQQATLEEQEATLATQQEDIDEKTELLAAQQEKIDNIIGVKADVIEALSDEFAAQNISVDIDSQTGAMTLEASVLFAYDEAELTEEGMATLQTVLPVYCSVLLQDAYKDYLAEIIIVGYTDTQGDYSYNLELSQRRSLAVAQYLLEIQGNFLTAEQSADLQEFLTVNGQSMSNPVLDADGNVDDDASRRVEVKFRLKDDEMMEELNSILSDLNTEETTDAAAAETADTDTAAEEAADTAAGETEETASEG